MKRKLYNSIALILLVLLPLIAFSGTEEKASESFYGQLKSLLTRPTLKIRPKTSERDVNLIEVEKGAAGVLFGATMDDVVAIWGKPSGLHIQGRRDIWDLYIGACRFGFIENELVSIGIHSATVSKAHFANGIGFESSFDDVLSAFGKPIEAKDYSLKFVNENGYVMKFQFVADTSSLGKRKLINITMYHPDSGK